MVLNYNKCFFSCKCCNKLSIKVEVTKNYIKRGCFNCNGCEFCIKGNAKKKNETMYIVSIIKCLYCDNNITYNYNNDSNIINITNGPKSLFNKKINDISINEKINEHKDNIITINDELQYNIILIKSELDNIQKNIDEINTTINTIKINYNNSLNSINLEINKLKLIY